MSSPCEKGDSLLELPPEDHLPRKKCISQASSFQESVLFLGRKWQFLLHPSQFTVSTGKVLLLFPRKGSGPSPPSSGRKKESLLSLSSLEISLSPGGRSPPLFLPSFPDHYPFFPKEIYPVETPTLTWFLPPPLLGNWKVPLPPPPLRWRWKNFFVRPFLTFFIKSGPLPFPPFRRCPPLPPPSLFAPPRKHPFPSSVAVG